MSVTIGVGYRNRTETEFAQYLTSIAERYGYGANSGLDSADRSVVEGIEGVVRILSWEKVVLLGTSGWNGAMFADAIHEDLYRKEMETGMPTFFSFVIDVEQSAKRYCDALWIFFASDWERDDLIRYTSGSAAELVQYLSRPGHWCERFLGQKGEFFDRTEFPLVLHMNLR